MLLEPLHIAALDAIDGALLDAARMGPFECATEEVSGEWLDAFPQELVKKAVEPREKPEVRDFSDSRAIRATLLRSETFGPRTVVVAPIKELVLGRGLGRDALTAAAHLQANLELADARVDVFLFLVARPDSEDTEGGVEVARRLERNEHICRAFVWIPTTKQASWPEEIKTVIARTFLARPFGSEAESSQNLDPLHEAIVQATVKQDSRAPSLLPDQASKWQVILTSENSGEEIAQLLVETLRDDEP